MLGFRTSASRGAASRAEAANLRLASDAGARRAEHCRAPAFLPCSVFAPARHAAPRNALRLQTFAWLRTQALAVRSTAEHLRSCHARFSHQRITRRRVTR